MRIVPSNFRTGLLMIFALLLGYAGARTSSRVEAQSRGYDAHTTTEPLDFQLTGIGPSTALTVYNPADHTLYVYPSVTMGNSKINCSYGLRMTRPGSPIERQNCQPGSLP